MHYKEFLEFKHLGFNVFTLSAMATIVFTVFEAWGLHKQSKLIREKKSGQSLDNYLFIYLIFMFVASIVYGIEINSLALIINGCLFLFCVPVLLGLGKYKGFSLKEKVFFVFCFVVLVFMLLSDVKEFMFLFIMSGIILALLSQLLEINKNKDSGVVEIKLILVYFISTFFWVVYSFLADDLTLFFVTGTSLIILFFIIYSWLKHNKEKNYFIVFIKGGEYYEKNKPK